MICPFQDYTSKIVNIGIQQKGIEDGVPQKIRKTSMDALELFMSQEDISELKPLTQKTESFMY